MWSGWDTGQKTVMDDWAAASDEDRLDGQAPGPMRESVIADGEWTDQRRCPRPGTGCFRCFLVGGPDIFPLLTSIIFPDRTGPGGNAESHRDESAVDQPWVGSRRIPDERPSNGAAG